MAIFSKEPGPHFHEGYFYVIVDEDFYCQYFPELTDKEIIDNLNFIRLLGGFMAMTLQVSKLEDTRPDMIPSMKKYFQILQGIAGQTFDETKCILVSKDYADMLTEEEYDAILFHEYAHILNGDIQEFSIEGKLRLITYVAYEIKADSYAASKTSAKTMADALVKVLLKKVVLKEGDYDKAKKLDEDVVRRLHALGY